jgi:transcriptional regulator with XRE-family HTH domain
MEIKESQLRRLYHEKELTQSEIAKRYGVSKDTISRRMSDYDIETRSRREVALRQFGVPSLRHDDNGYEKFNGERTHVLHHRLLAVADYGYDAVVEHHVHHINEIEWDNRPTNIELMKVGEHASHHHRQTSFTDDLLMMELYHNSGKTQSKIGEMFGINQSEVSRRVTE